jgi:hypothetical protein
VVVPGSRHDRRIMGTPTGGLAARHALLIAVLGTGGGLLPGCNDSPIFTARPAPLFTPTEQIATTVMRRQRLTYAAVVWLRFLFATRLIVDCIS